MKSDLTVKVCLASDLPIFVRSESGWFNCHPSEEQVLVVSTASGIILAVAPIVFKNGAKLKVSRPVFNVSAIDSVDIGEADSAVGSKEIECEF